MEIREYTLKGFRRNNCGSNCLLNEGMIRYKDEVGLSPSLVTLSELRRETLSDTITERQLSLTDGGQCHIAFDTHLALNEMRLSGITPQRVVVRLNNQYERFSRWLRTTYPGAQIKQTGDQCVVTLNQESWSNADEERWLYAPASFCLMREEAQEALRKRRLIL